VAAGLQLRRLSNTEFNGDWRPAKQYQNCADMRHSSL
jgi:hypothetical protein